VRNPKLTDVAECLACGHTVTIAECRRILAADGKCPICGETKPPGVLDAECSVFAFNPKGEHDGDPIIFRVPGV
jgi:hypothetical protein